MEDIAHWTDWGPVGIAIAIILVAGALLFVALVVVDGLKDRRKNAPTVERPCCLGRHDTGDDADEEPAPPVDTSDWWRNGPDLSDQFWRANPTDPLKLTEVVRWNNIVARHEWVDANTPASAAPGPDTPRPFRGLINRASRRAA